MNDRARILVIADDLTGALEAGAKFSEYGLGTVVTTDRSEVLTDAVVVVDTETRHVSDDAAERCVAAIPLYPEALIYKKTDSTLRGNIRAELRALQREYGGRIAYVPAYPQLGRTVRDGCVFVDGVPLGESSFARDLLNPVQHGNVRALVGADLDCVVFDGESQEDVERAADEIVRSGFRIVSGPAAIASALAARLGTPLSIAWPAVRRCLVANGSRHEVSRQQIAAVADDGEWQIFRPEVEGTWAPAAYAQEMGLQICRMLDAGGYDGVMVFGGDTAYGVLRALGARRLRAVGEVVAGVPVSKIEGRREILISKAGGFGGPDLIQRVRRKLNGR